MSATDSTAAIEAVFRMEFPRVVASVAAIDRAFHTTIDLFRLGDRRTVFANVSAPALPAQAAVVVNAVLGLDDIGSWRSLLESEAFRALLERETAPPLAEAA